MMWPSDLHHFLMTFTSKNVAIFDSPNCGLEPSETAIFICTLHSQWWSYKLQLPKETCTKQCELDVSISGAKERNTVNSRWEIYRHPLYYKHQPNVNPNILNTFCSQWRVVILRLCMLPSPLTSFLKTCNLFFVDGA